MATSSSAMTCCRVILAGLGFIFMLLTILSSIFLVLMVTYVSDCDLTCDEHRDGAELLGEGIYDCDGEKSCGPLQPFFYIALGTTAFFVFGWIVIIAVCCRRNRIRKATVQPATEASIADTRRSQGSVPVASAPESIVALGQPVAGAQPISHEHKPWGSELNS